MRGCLWLAQDAAARAQLVPYIEAVFAAYFQDDQDRSYSITLPKRF